MTFFKVMGTIVTVAVAVLWFVVASRTFAEGFGGKIFYAPCLASVGDRIPEALDMTTPPRRASGINSSSTTTSSSI